jgi:hypothetical protein
MAGDGQSFGKEICTNVDFSRHEDDAKVSLPHAAPQPIEAHVQRLRHLEVDGIGRETDGDFVVAEEWCWRFGVTHILQDLALLRWPAAKSPAYLVSATNEQTTGIRVE